MGLRKLLSIAKFTFLDQIRSRLYLVIVFFCALVLAASLIVGSLAPGFSVRVIFDLGLLAIEVFALLTAVFSAVTVVTQDLENKTIYILISRPLPRPIFLLGRFVGLMAAVLLMMAAMALFHVILLKANGSWFADFTQGWSFWTTYPVLIMMSALKVFVVAVLALFFSLFATSAPSALVFTFCLWFLGHFGQEMSFLLNKTLVGFPKFLIDALLFVVPNFQILNFRDLFMTPGFSLGSFVGWGSLYAGSYAGLFLILSFILFSKKEF